MTLASMPDPISILGVEVIPFESYSHAIQCVEERITSRQKTFCVAINPEKIYRAVHDPELLSALGHAEIGICDGVGVVLAARILYGPGLTRCTGVDLFFRIVAQAAERGWKIFLLGASPKSNEEACKKLLLQYPNLQVVGRHDGYFQDDARVVEQINRSGADILFVAMGSPRQEIWIDRYRQSIDASLCMGVGGTFDVLSGQVRRAPAFFRRTGTEFLFRLVSEPRRWRRQLALPLFMVSVLKRKLIRSAS